MKYGIENFESLDTAVLHANLTGSEKQIAWANDLIKCANHAIDRELAVAKENFEKGLTSEKSVDAWRITKRIYQNTLDKRNSAREIIDTRSFYCSTAAWDVEIKILKKIDK